MVLRAGVERALVHPGVPAEILQSLDETLAQINQMTEMVENLLTLARADEGRAPLAVEECDLRDLVTDVAETAGILGEHTGVTAEHTMPETPVRLAVDRHRIREMLLNLVTNAIKYTPRGGSLALALEENEDAVTFTVRDTGIGIAAGDLPHIFERFWRADPARSRTGDRPGVGLGLAIAKWIVEAHGGSITVQSRPGTLFTIRLPKAREVAWEHFLTPFTHPVCRRHDWRVHRAVGRAMTGALSGPGSRCGSGRSCARPIQATPGGYYRRGKAGVRYSPDWPGRLRLGQGDRHHRLCVCNVVY